MLERELYQLLLAVQSRPDEVRRSARWKHEKAVRGIRLLQTNGTIDMIGEEIVGVVEWTVARGRG